MGFLNTVFVKQLCFAQGSWPLNDPILPKKTQAPARRAVRRRYTSRERPNIIMTTTTSRMSHPFILRVKLLGLSFLGDIRIHSIYAKQKPGENFRRKQKRRLLRGCLRDESILGWLSRGRCWNFIRLLSRIIIHPIEFGLLFGYGPLTVTVTTWIITFLGGNPYKPSFATVTVRGPHPKYYHVYLYMNSREFEGYPANAIPGS